MKKIQWFSLLTAIVLFLVMLLPSALAWSSESLTPGSRGEEVRRMQEALIKLKYLKGTADGVYGTNTENAVRKFQRKNGLKVDGVAGKKTLALIYAQAEKVSPGTPTPAPTGTPSPTAAPTPTPTSGTGLFGGNYTKIKLGDTGERVKILQQALKTLKYLSGKADGIFGKATWKAVKKFQQAKKLTADGVAGRKTLQALEKAMGQGQSTPTPTPAPTPTPTGTSQPPTPVTIPSIGSVRLLHWFNDIKPTLNTRQTILVVDPSSGISWTLKLYSLGRHADAEPLTAADTANMVQAFGGKNTWNQKAVYVRLPSGQWTIGSTHDMPHMSGSIKDNNFDGHLCVHFLRDMDECKKNDPNYGVANQNTIRAFWKSLTGETVE